MEREEIEDTKEGRDSKNCVLINTLKALVEVEELLELGYHRE